MCVCWHCIVKSESGMVEIIYSTAPVELRLRQMNSTVNETAEVVFACEAFGLPAPDFTWTGPSDLSSRSDNDQTLMINSSEMELPEGGVLTRSELRFLSIKDTDAGQYTCTASNMPNSTLSTSDNASFTVVVQSPFLLARTYPVLVVLVFASIQ